MSERLIHPESIVAGKAVTPAHAKIPHSMNGNFWFCDPAYFNKFRAINMFRVVQTLSDIQMAAVQPALMTPDRTW